MQESRDVANMSSARVRLNQVPIGAVTLRDGFWKSRVDANRTAGIPAFLAWLDRDDQTAPFRAFASGDSSAISAGIETLRANYEGRNYHRLPHHWRANVLAWVEACAWALQSADDPDLRATLDTLVHGIVAAHENPDFLAVYYGDDYEHSYQLATPGHLIQAAIAHHILTGETSFLNCAKKVADDILAKFTGQRFAEHPCIEMALVELYRTTGEQRYLDGARHFLEPLLRQSAAIGPDEGEGDWRHFNRHVVRQTYLCAGGADYLVETGDQSFRSKLEAIWEDMTSGKMHVTGQLAVDPICPERVTAKPFELSTGVFGVLQGTTQCGCELCEAVGNAFWNWRMLQATGDAKYMDQFERLLYNGFLAHVSLEGDKFHYLCALASDGDHTPRTIWGHPETSCCPPNALRLIASLPGYFCSTSAEGVWVHLYDNCALDCRLDKGLSLKLDQQTNCPWDGKVLIGISVSERAKLTLHLRIPGWCADAQVAVNGQPVAQPVVPGSYCAVHRTWNDGDMITLNLPMPVVGITADPRAADFQDKLALMRGPLVYCFEGADNPDTDVWDIRIPGQDSGVGEWLYRSTGFLDSFEPVYDANLLGGVTSLRGERCVAIPYYAWNNRGQHKMRVWVGR